MNYGAIDIDPSVLNGTPVFAGTNVPVQAFFEYLQDGKSMNKFLDDFPAVNKKHAIEVLQMATRLLTREETLNKNFSE
jgi:uncharacterized protein (DUF433 family)